MKWEPIETAPKDGSLVLVTDGTYIEVAKNFGSGWISSDGLDFGYGAWDDRLTHWMKLPEPPNAVLTGAGHKTLRNNAPYHRVRLKT